MHIEDKLAIEWAKEIFLTFYCVGQTHFNAELLRLINAEKIVSDSGSDV